MIILVFFVFLTVMLALALLGIHLFDDVSEDGD